MHIYVDADACPVKDIIIEEGTRAGIPIVFVSDYSHFSNTIYPPGVKTIYVDNGADSVDYRIVKLARKGDIVVTQDYGLASLVLPKGCTVLHHKGFIYTPENIIQLLTKRYVNAMTRKHKGFSAGPNPFTPEKDHSFRELLKQTILSVTHHYN